MSQGIRPLQPGELASALEEIILPKLLATIAARSAGHCMRLLDLDRELMIMLGGRLRAEVPDAQVVILDDGRQNRGSQAVIPAELAVSATKLVELRNPEADGSLRPPLLVMIPPGVRTAAEDSFDVATFEEIKLGDVYGDLRDNLLQRMPVEFRSALVAMLRELTQTSDRWRYANEVAVVRFLLTAVVNIPDAEAIGAAIYEMGLVPDFELLHQPAQAADRVRRNRECVQSLTWSAHSERRRVLGLKLADAAFRAKLGKFLEESGLDDPRVWTRRIALQREFWGLSFQQWRFGDEPEDPSSIYIGNVQVQLPEVSMGQAQGHTAELAGQQVLRMGGGASPKLKVSFEVDPHPNRVEGLSKFIIQVVSKTNGPIGLTSTKKAWKSGRAATSLTFSKLDKVEWEEGWHFIRVYAVSEQGDALQLVDANGTALSDIGNDSENGTQQPNESDYFFVLFDEDGTDFEPAQRAIPHETSRTHALFNKQFSALLSKQNTAQVEVASVAWQDQSTQKRASSNLALDVKFRREGSVQILVSSILGELEQRILEKADGPLSWRLMITNEGQPKLSPDIDQWPRRPEAQEFVAARRAYFAAIRQGDSDLITQAADFHMLRPLAVTYAEQYTQLVQTLLHEIDGSSLEEGERARGQLGRLLILDTIALTIHDHQGGLRRASLLAPTHPLRALWFSTWSMLGEQWLVEAERASAEFVTQTRETLLRLLSPLNFPPVLLQSGSLYSSVDNIHPFWSLYAPADEVNPRALVGDVCAALGLAEPGIAGAVIDGPYLASRVQRYLVQHPYVSTLVVNAFNAGRATALAEMLIHLQKQPAFADLRYDIRLFVPDPDSPGAGEALAELLDPGTASTSETVDVFSGTTGDHLQPKLALAVRSIEEFQEGASGHRAHISMLFDLFPPEEIGTEPVWQADGIAPLFGLLQDFHVEYQEESELVIWKRQPVHGSALSLAGGEELTDLLTQLPHLLSNAAAAVATGQIGGDRRPTIKLVLDGAARHLLFQIHEVSDWVFTIDRNLGIEFFDHGPAEDRPDYLIDHSPDLASRLGHRLVITSRATAEIEALIVPVLAHYGLPTTRQIGLAVLEQLRSLSGRLALKLISATSQRAEALGLALARMYLEYQGVFTNQIVLPLDVHLDLYKASRQTADELGSEVSFKRTDLALFDLDAVRRTITCRLVEVKCYSHVGSIGDYQAMQGTIVEQIAQSKHVLRQHFDPEFHRTDRPDRPVKSHEFAILLGFYLDRAERYGLIADAAAAEARQFIRTLEGGYRLAFTQSALVFDFGQPGTEQPTVEDGIEFHRIGYDLVRDLMEAHADVPGAPTTWEEPLDLALPVAQAVLQNRRERVPSVPTLRKAAFLSEPRDHTTVPDEQLYVKRMREIAEEKSIADTVSLDKASGARRVREDAKGSTYEAEAYGTTPNERVDLDMPTNREPLAAALEAATLVASAAITATGIEPAPTLETDGPVVPDEDVAGTEIAKPDEKIESIAGIRPIYDVMLGTATDSPQYGLIGEKAGRKIALDLNQTHTISLFGVQGGGKSYTLGTIVEMASLSIPHINYLPNPLATVIFHYSPTMDYAPEFTSMVAPNSNEGQLQLLRERYGAEPRALEDVVLLVPEDQVAMRQAEYPAIAVYPLKFAASELQVSHWRFLMGAVGNQATYVRQIIRIMRSLRNDLTLEHLRAEIEASSLPEHLKNLGLDRLNLAGDFIDDQMSVSMLLRPGRLVIVDLRDDFLEKDAALGLFVVLLQLFADAKYEGKNFNKLVVFDEAHKYIENADLVDGLVEVVREMRHKGTSIMVASQDPPSVPTALIELSSQIILHRFNSPQWLKHIQRANTSLGNLTPDRMAQLRAGEAYVWSAKASDDTFCREAVKITCRPRVTQHGGDTKTAVQE